MKKMSLLFCLLVVCMAASQFSLAQVIVSSTTSGSAVTLNATLPGSAASTTTPVALTSDDGYSGLLPIGFTFNYYGVPHTQCLVGSNGNINFTSSLAGSYDTWTINTPLLGNMSARNCICAAWGDLCLPCSTPAGTIYYHTDGVAPNRKFVVTYCHNGIYACPTQYQSTTTVLYETTDEIDILVSHHVTGCSWAGGYTIEGIQDSAGTDAVVVPGRDYPSSWSANNDAYRFSPSGTTYTVGPIAYSPPYAASEVTFNWYDSTTGAYVGSGSPLVVYPTVPTTYAAVAVSCASDSFTAGYAHRVMMLSVPAGSATMEVSVFPNPTNDVLNIQMYEGAYSSLTITDAVGQLFTEQKIKETLTEVNVKTFPAGVYYIMLNGDYGSKMMKFVKW